MKIVAIVPIKSNSKRVKNKNFKIINNKPLYKFLLDKLNKTNFDEIFIDSDSSEIKKYSLSKGFKFIERIPLLAKDNANGNDLLNFHSTIITADIYFQLFITAPLLSVKTINNCINIIKKNKKIDLILTAQKLYSWFWFEKSPVNYNPRILPRSQDAKPIIQESTGLYGIRHKSLLKYKCRIGKKPYFYFIDDKEAFDLDDVEDLKYFKYLKNIKS